MTLAPKHPCRSPGCSMLIPMGGGSYCPPHTRAPREVAREADRFRGTAHERGYDARWVRARGLFLQQYPVCMGVLIPNMTAWSRVDAVEFHRLREADRAEGMVMKLTSATLGFLEAHGIYRLEPWDQMQAATVVDHIIPHRGDQELFWAEWNWQPLTKRAHDRKTATEDRPKS